MNRKAVGLIRQCIGQEVFHHVAQETDAYTLWTKLEGMYQSKTSRNKALLMRRLVNLKLKSGNSVAVHSSEFQNLVNQLASVGMKLDDELDALLLLSSLPDDWETLVVSLSNSAPDGKLTTTLVKDALFNEEARRKEMGTDYDDGSRALATDGNRGRSPGRGNKNRRGGGSRSRPRGGTLILGSFTCYHCQEEGHIKRNCHKYKAEKGKGKDQSKDAAGVVHESDGELMVTVKSCCQAWEKRYRVFGWTRGTSIADTPMERTREYTERKGTGILRMGAPKTKKRVSFACDLVSGGDLSGVVDTGGGKDPLRTVCGNSIYDQPPVEPLTQISGLSKSMVLLIDREICMISNIPPESADEVFVLAPSLKGKKNSQFEVPTAEPELGGLVLRFLQHRTNSNFMLGYAYGFVVVVNIR
ncbi:hypothetical protein RHSIM_Rhsim02G0089300 [Rhododendron simsii]|uniref:CCHC-type domain-containing protein n=1 Tax=Rhododendron simsii TaxID=118357 RepID=A0A834HCH0_RHOSS|nr:hypothetical protein RHSIM_Rhsim02G0089300 [Rhododendron simsii]